MGTIRFSRNYFLVLCTILSTEIVIALYIHDTLIRPFIGDLLAVVLVYCGIKTCIRGKKKVAVTLSLGIAFCIELLQATPFLEWIGFSTHKMALMILGSTFDWLDILAYSVGAVLIIIFEYLISYPCTVKTF